MVEGFLIEHECLGWQFAVRAMMVNFGMIRKGIGKGPLRDEAGIYAFFEVGLG
jgi:hypothetical protein